MTRIISQLTIQHAAVNYPLSDYAEYIPNLPTKLYNDTRVKEGKFDVLRLPNRKTSSVSMNLFTTIVERVKDAVASLLMHSTSERAVRARAQAEDIVFCS